MRQHVHKELSAYIDGEARHPERIAEHLQVRYYDHFAMVCYLAQVEVLRGEKF